MGRCVNAEPAADLPGLLVPELLKALLAADPALLWVTLWMESWAKAEPAADLAALLAFGLRRVLEAAEAAFLLVVSDLFRGAMILSYHKKFTSAYVFGSTIIVITEKEADAQENEQQPE